MKKSVRKIWAVLTTALLAFSLAACGNPAGGGESTESEITIGEAVTFSTFDPYGMTMDGMGFMHYYKLVYENLVEFENGEAVPALAESWESDGDTWTFHLRKDVTFTDGAPFTAEAVKLNYECMQENMMDMISYYSGVSRVSEFEVLDEHTIAFHYDAPYYAVLENLSAIAFGILSPRLFEDGQVPYGTVTETAGSGPYALKAGDYADGTAYTFARNPQHWREATGPDRFTVKIIPDPDARMMALQSGEIDLLYGTYQMTYDMYDYLSAQDGIETVQSEAVYATRNLLLNTARDNLGDVRVRRAIQHGTDKQQINDTILHGLESPADTLFPLDLRFCDVEQAVYGYDPEQANRLLDEAGWREMNDQGIRVKDGVSLRLDAICMSDRTIDEQILMAFKGQMAKIGVEVNVASFENTVWFEMGLMGEFDISVNDTYAFPQDPQVFVAAMLDTGLDNPAQQGLAQKPEIDERIAAMLTTADENVIRDSYGYVLSTLADEAVNLPLCNMREIVAYNAGKIETFVFWDAGHCAVDRIVLK